MNMSKYPSVTIALATYNGESFLAELLDSLLCQTYYPIKIVACDDGSLDKTVDILREYEKKHDCLTVYQNAQNLGYVQNFAHIIDICDGEIVFLCDQDDVWWPDKVKIIVDTFNQHPQAGLVFTNGVVTDSTLQPTYHYVYEYDYLDARQATRHFWDGRYSRPLGCSLAFRGELKPLLLPIPPNSYWGHDHWIAHVIAGIMSVIYLPQPLFFYRRNAGSSGNNPYIDKRIIPVLKKIRSNLMLEEYYKTMRRAEAVLLRLQDIQKMKEYSVKIDQEILEQNVQMYRKRLDFYRKRYQMRQIPRYYRIRTIWRLQLTQQYKMYARGWRTAIKDFWA